MKTWMTFIYHGTLVNKITNLFKHTKARIAFKLPTPYKNLKKQKRTVIYMNV